MVQVFPERSAGTRADSAIREDQVDLGEEIPCPQGPAAGFELRDHLNAVILERHGFNTLARAQGRAIKAVGLALREAPGRSACAARLRSSPGCARRCPRAAPERSWVPRNEGAPRSP